MNRPTLGYRDPDSVIRLVAIQSRLDAELCLEHLEQLQLILSGELLGVQIQSAVAFASVIHEPNREGRRRQRELGHDLAAVPVERLEIRRQLRAAQGRESVCNASTVSGPRLWRRADEVDQQL